MAVQMSKFSRKQAGVIYRAFKQNEVKMEQAAVSRMYDLVNDGGCVDYNGEINREIQDLLIAIEAIFENDYQKAQKHLDRFAA